MLGGLAGFSTIQSDVVGGGQDDSKLADVSIGYVSEILPFLRERKQLVEWRQRGIWVNIRPSTIQYSDIVLYSTQQEAYE